MLYVLRPLAFEKLELQPEFETTAVILEGEAELKGHLRPVYLVYVAVRLFFDKNLKYVLKRIKESEETEYESGQQKFIPEHRRFFI